jgi:hypothetical protein
MANRKTLPPPVDWTSSLNLIDVIFSEDHKVVALWHALYTVLETKPWNPQRFNHELLEMMSGMARALGYRTLTQTDIDKFYVPEVHGTLASKQQ